MCFISQGVANNHRNHHRHISIPEHNQIPVASEKVFKDIYKEDSLQLDTYSNSDMHRDSILPSNKIISSQPDVSNGVYTQTVLTWFAAGVCSGYIFMFLTWVITINIKKRKSRQNTIKDIINVNKDTDIFKDALTIHHNPLYDDSLDVSMII